MENKKILFYAGGALVLGAVTFFVWSFFQKPIVPIGDTTVLLGEEDETPTSTTSGNNPFTDLANVDFGEIQTPNIAGDIENLIRGR